MERNVFLAVGSKVLSDLNTNKIHSKVRLVQTKKETLPAGASLFF
jgi:hypothetical protein